MIYIGYHWNCRLWRYSTKGNALWGTPPGQKREKWFWKIKRSPFIIWFIEKRAYIFKKQIPFCPCFFSVFLLDDILILISTEDIITCLFSCCAGSWREVPLTSLEFTCISCSEEIIEMCDMCYGVLGIYKKRVIIRGSKDCCDMVDKLGDSWFLLKGH